MCQLTVVGCAWVVVGCAWVVVGCAWVVVGCAWVVVGCDTQFKQLVSLSVSVTFAIFKLFVHDLFFTLIIVFRPVSRSNTFADTTQLQHERLV